MVPIYLSRPTISTKRPLMMVIHEWWGLTDHIRSIADRYANLGYVAAVPDLFGGVVAKDRNEAMVLSQKVTPEQSSQLLTSAVDYLTRKDSVLSNKVGIHGFCFGGSHTFNFICESKRITAAVIFYASVFPPKERMSNIACPMLIVYGDKDHAVKPDQLKELEATLKKMKKNVQVELYPDAGHAFANDTGQNYNAEAAKKAWEATEKFLGTYLPLPKI
jgi:carboxymethylenebutenolidase